MPRLTNLNDVLFPVEEHPVFAHMTTDAGKRQVPVPEKTAIVNRTNGRVLGIVSRGYRLVSNREALDMAKDCCRVVFPQTKPSEWDVRTADAPGSGGHCFIDLVHNSTVLDFSFVPAKDRPDAFGPFIRVTNSYNGLRALGFDIGYYRKVCKNGLILPQSVIRFKFTHMHRDIGVKIEFKIAHDEIAKIKESMGDYFKILKTTTVQRKHFEPLVHAALLVSKPKNARPETREAIDWNKLENHITEMCDRYAKDLGDNAYAVFNAVTEFASHPPENRCVFRERHSFQRRAGLWLTDFTRESCLPGFSLEQHIEKIAKNGSNDEDSISAVRRRHP